MSFAESISISSNVPAPACSDLRGDIITGRFSDENSTSESIHAFVTRWPPSRTPLEYCPWIALDRGTNPVTPRIDSMKASFSLLAATNSITVASLDQIASENGSLSGKWMVFCDSSQIDALWLRILEMVCLHRKKGYVKVSPNKDDNQHVICVYVDDFTNEQEVKGLRQDLRSIGVTWGIGFKLDAYTYLDIYRNNPWGIRPNRYFE